MKELLLKYAFRFDGTCNCNGTFNEKYRKNVYLFKIQPTQQTWKLELYGKQIASGNSSNLLNKLHELFPEVVE